SGGEIDAEPTTTWQGAGFAVSFPTGSRVRAEAEALSVDLPDGVRWFDARWADRPEVPELALRRWGEATCQPARWDRVARPTSDTWASGGLCTIDDRRRWMFAALEVHDDRALLTVYLANRDRVTYEDAVVDYVTSALSLGGGAAPIDTPSKDAVRATLREVV